MSWVFAAVSRANITSELKSTFQQTHTKAQYTFEQENLYITSAGPEFTTICHLHYPQHNSGYLILGSPLWAVGNGFHFLGMTDWDQFIWTDANIKLLEGHYAILKWEGNHLQCWTDPIGLRDFLILETDWGYVITTRLDWAVQMQIKRSFNRAALAAHLMLGSTCGTDTIMNNVSRIFKGMKAVISPTQLSIQEISFTDTKPTIHDQEELYSDIQKRILLPFTENRKLSLALSGGLDSRTVLSYLMHPGAKQYRSLWDAYTIGTGDESDVQTASLVAKEMNIRHHVLIPQFSPVQDLWEYMKENVLAMRMDMLPSSTNRYRFMFDMQGEYDGIIDGGSGWLLKYQVSREMGIKHKHDIMMSRWDKIVPSLWGNTPFFLCDEIRQQMKADGFTRMTNLMSRIKSPRDLGFYNWLNQFFIDTHLPYNYSSQQIWLDGILQDYMPTMSHIVMQNVLQIPTRDKLNNKICYRFIKRNDERLLHIPRTSYGLQLPCQTDTMVFAVYARIKQKLSPAKPMRYNIKFWKHLREPVLDRLHSSAVKQYEDYDWNHIREYVEGFYAGKEEYAGKLDQWLRFDIWRELVSG